MFLIHILIIICIIWCYIGEPSNFVGQSSSFSHIILNRCKLPFLTKNKKNIIPFVSKFISIYYALLKIIANYISWKVKLFTCSMSPNPFLVNLIFGVEITLMSWGVHISLNFTRGHLFESPNWIKPFQNISLVQDWEKCVKSLKLNLYKSEKCSTALPSYPPLHF